MKPRLRIVLTNEIIFVISFFTFSMINWFGPVYGLNFLSYGFAAWAIFIFFSRIWLDRTRYLLHNIGGIVFAISYCVTVVLNRSFNDPLFQMRTLAWIFIFFIVIFGSSQHFSSIFRLTKGVGLILQILTIFAGLIGLWMYYANVIPWLRLPNGSVALIGVINSRLFGIYTDPNFGALIGVLAIVYAMGFFLFDGRAGGQRVIAVISIVVNLLYIGLAYSRTGYISLVLAAIFLTISFAIRAWHKYRHAEKGKVRFYRWLFGRCILIVLILVMVWKPIWNKERAFSIANAVGLEWNYEDHHSSAKSLENTSEEEKIQDKSSDKVNFVNQDSRRNTISSSNERVDLMKESIQLWRFYPFFGVGDRNIQVAAMELMPNSLLSLGKVPHNGYIFVLLSAGIVGTVFLLGWLLWLFLTWLYTLRRHKFNLRLWFHAIPVIICAVSALFLQDLFLIMSPTALIFWLNLGICANLSSDMTIEL